MAAHQQYLLGQHEMAQPLSGRSRVSPEEIQHSVGGRLASEIGLLWGEDPSERWPSLEADCFR